MTRKTLTPTAEQQAAIDLAMTGKSMAVEALAGTGKTSTLGLIAEALGREGKRGLFLSFSKAIVTEAAERMPANVSCSTAHSLAFRAVGKNYAARLKAPRMRVWDIARFLGCTPFVVELDGNAGKRRLSDGAIATMAGRAIRNFTLSADDAPGPQHVPGLDVATYESNRAFKAHVAAYLDRYWADITDNHGRLPFTHDCYLKIWQLSGPRLNSDFVLYDEAQDCQPPDTMVLTPDRGEVAIAKLKAGDRVVSYVQNGLRFRAKGSIINKVVERPFDGELIRVSARNGFLLSEYTPGHHCVVKVGPAFRGKSLVYVMAKGSSFRVGVTSASHGRGDRVSSGPAGRMLQEQADAIWILAAFDDKRDALMLEAEVAARFGLPDMRFVDSGQQSIGQDRLDAFWSRMGDLTPQAKDCLTDFGRDIAYPLARRGKGYLLYNRSTIIRACNLMDGMVMLDARTALVRPGKKVTRDDEAWVPITVDRVAHRGSVWSLDVDEDHTYVADGLVTHNCNPVMLAIVEENRDRCQLIFVGDRHQQIYSWRGAANAMAEAPVDGRTYLTQSFRFGAGVATVANVVLERLGAEQLVQGNPALVSTYGPMDGDADAVLCRTNAELITQVMSEVEAGRRPGVVGGVDEIVAFAKAATDLMNGRSTTHPNLTGFDSWSDVLAYVESPACDDDDLARLVKLLNTHDPVKIINVLSRCADVRDADVVFSTAHKAKGLEWNRVRLAGDFDYDLNDAAPETLRLLYVAITRAKGHIDLGPMHAQLVEEA